jgi:tRNA/tmRNA/rRNA uracil-C5-methylase (TrmA/RlmC/RlmD family)
MAFGRLEAVTRRPARNAPVGKPDSSAPVIVDVTISGLDHEGRGHGRVESTSSLAEPHASTLVRVPFTMPGDRVRARVWRSARDGLEADLLEVLVPASDRVSPPCGLFGVCAGCQLQHLPYRRQLDFKTSVVRELVARLDLAHKVIACIGSPRELGYRSKITPHHERPRPGQPLAIGFLRIGRHRHDVVDVKCCPLATEAINARLPQLRVEIAAAAPTRRKGASFLVREASSGVTTDSDARVTERIGGLELEFFAREFFQNNPFLLPTLVTFVVDAAASSGAKLLVDAYCGSGLFALAAAARFEQVTGVEVSPGAVAAARENATRNHIGNARFVTADAGRVFSEIDRPGDEAAVIIDPPRKGCGQPFLDQLIAFGPRTVVYVSCNPEAMSRDLGHMTRAGYDVRALQPFDMFPQTRHVECVAVLSLERQRATPT